jgi:hypothetical protein
MDPGLKGCSYLLGKVPSWMSLTEREKMEWLNRLLSELWPYYDRGICSMVKEVVEPILESLRPPGIIRRIFFQEFTFGTAPFRVEGISVKEDPNAVDMELDVRWSGDANITLGIDLPAGGEFTRLTPKVTDIVFVATLKVIMKPLVDEIPGFAGVAVALKSPPTIKYRLNFGALSGGSVTTAPIVAFINFVVKEVIVGMLLWPRRVTVPILGTGGVLTGIMGHPPMPDVDLEVERLNGRQQGVVKVTVLAARELKAYDAITGKSDPFVELFTTQDHRCRTRVVKRSLSPQWGEVFYLPVLEKDQVLRCEVFDHDDVNVTAAASSGLKIWQAPGKVLGAREFMGRAAVPLAPFIAEEGLEDERWFALGKADWTNVMGPGKGEGQVRLGLQYRAVENIAGEEIENAAQGLLLVSVIRAEGLGGDAKSGPLRLVTAKLTPPKREAGAAAAIRARLAGGGDGSVSHSTPKLRGDSPRWMSENKFTFYDVSLEVRRFVCLFVCWGGGFPGEFSFEMVFFFVGARPSPTDRNLAPPLKTPFPPPPPRPSAHTQDTISLMVVEAGTLTNTTLGSVTLAVPEIVRRRQRSRWTKEEQAGYYHRRVPITDAGAAGATLEVEIEFLPYW